jgi:hypothetical protein
MLKTEGLRFVLPIQEVAVDHMVIVEDNDGRINSNLIFLLNLLFILSFSVV